MQLTYLGTATVDLRIGGTRLLTDPVFDPIGSAYDFGPWFTPRSWFSSEKRYQTPVDADALGDFDAVLVSHDHHGDNLDLAGRALVADASRVARVVTTEPGARRLARPPSRVDAPGHGLGLGTRVSGLAPGASTRIGNVTITATVARHGPRFTPRVHEVVGFVLDVDRGPRIWISGDTVMFPALAAALERLRDERPIDVALVHCGAVRFAHAPGFQHARFTFDAREAAQACKLLDAGTIVPVHRSGWAHFQQSEDDLLTAFDDAGLLERTRMLELGATIDL